MAGLLFSKTTRCTGAQVTFDGYVETTNQGECKYQVTEMISFIGFRSDCDIEREMSDKFAQKRSNHGTYKTWVHNVKITRTDNTEPSEPIILEDIRMYRQVCNIESTLADNYGYFETKDDGMCVPECLRVLYSKTIPSIMNDDTLLKILTAYDDYEERDDPRTLRDGFSCNDIKHFAQKYNIPMYALTLDEKAFFSYYPEKRNKNHRALVFLMSNNHMYLATNKAYIQSISEKNKPMQKSFTKKSLLTARNKVDASLHEFRPTQCLREEFLDTYFTTGKMYGVKNTNNLFSQLIDTPSKSIYANGDKDEVIEFLQKLEENGISIPFRNQNCVTLGMEIFAHHRPKHKKSSFNPIFYKTVSTEFRKGPICRRFNKYDAGKHGSLVTCDINKCYTASALNNKHDWIVFGVMDHIEPYEPYDNQGIFQGIKRVGVYYVHTENNFPMKGNGWYTYGFLMDCEERNIPFKTIYQAIASDRLPANYFVETINTIQRLGGRWKFVINAIWGMMLKTIYDTYKTRHTTSFEEALKYHIDNLNSYKKQRDSSLRKSYVIKHMADYDDLESDSLYELTTHSIREESTNNLPIAQQIMETAWIQVFDLSLKMGGEIIYVKTDCVCTTGSEPVISEGIGGYRHEKYNGKFDVADKPPVDEKKEYPPLLWDKIFTEDDFGGDFDEICKFILGGNSCFIDGRAGTGKTHLCKMLNSLCEKGNKKVVNIAYTNSAALLIKGMTIHRAFGINPNNTDEFSTGKMSKIFSRADVVVIDEISMIGSQLWKHICQLKQNYPDLVFVLAGHFWQLPPVGEEEEDFENNAVLKILANQTRIELNKCRRSDSIIYDLTHDFYVKHSGDLSKIQHHFGTKHQEISLCRTNKTRKKLNEKVMQSKLHIPHLFIPKLTLTPAQIKIDYQCPSQNVWLIPGTPLMALHTVNYRSDGTAHRWKNDNYVVDSFTDTDVTVRHKTNLRPPETIKISEFPNEFVVAYAMTIHKSQGTTIDVPYTIHDANLCKHDPKMIYVALSRGTNVKNINIITYNNSNDPMQDYPPGFVAKKIDSYRHDDLSKGRICDLDYKYVKGLVIRQDNECHHCGVPMAVKTKTWTLDRIDDTKGHQKKNVVISCLNCNISKKMLDP